jgi:hypothetical protein
VSDETVSLYRDLGRESEEDGKNGSEIHLEVVEALLKSEGSVLERVLLLIRTERVSESWWLGGRLEEGWQKWAKGVLYRFGSWFAQLVHQHNLSSCEVNGE